MSPFVAIGDHLINTRRVNYIKTLEREPKIKIAIHFAPSDPVELAGEDARMFMAEMLKNARRLKAKRGSAGGKEMPVGPAADETADVDDDDAAEGQAGA
jgi:hypothetical protein